MSAFSSCSETYGSDEQSMLMCIANALETSIANANSRQSNWLLTLAGTLVFLMQLGFAMLSAGCVRRKNASNLLLKTMLDTCTACIGFFLVGYAFAFGGQDPNVGAKLVGTYNFLLTGTVSSMKGNRCTAILLCAHVCCSLVTLGMSSALRSSTRMPVRPWRPPSLLALWQVGPNLPVEL